jgi:hypothetical protein
VLIGHALSPPGRAMVGVDDQGSPHRPCRATVVARVPDGGRPHLSGSG